MAASKFVRMDARRALSSTRTKRVGWQLPTEGASAARSKSSASVASSGAWSGRKWRTSRRQARSSAKVAWNAASNWGASLRASANSAIAAPLSPNVRSRLVWHNARGAVRKENIMLFARRPLCQATRSGAGQGHRVGSFANCAIRSRLERSTSSGRQAVRPTASRGRRTRDELACAARSPCRARFWSSNPRRCSPRSVQWARGMKPGTPVSTTGLRRTFVVMPWRISRMASSGRLEMSKFSWIREAV